MKNGKENIISIGNIATRIAIYIAIVIVFMPQVLMSKEDNGFLKIKEVIDDENIKNNSGYEYGKIRYPKYRKEGLSASFLIKKQPDVVLSCDDIEAVEISEMYPSKQKIEAYWLTFYFTPSGAIKIRDIHLKNINKKIAYEVHDTVLIVATVLGQIGEEVTVPITNLTLAKLKDILNEIREKIIIREGNVYGISPEGHGGRP